jgi:hypothetical protein
MGEKRRANRVLFGKPERRKTGKPRRRWKNNIKINLTEVEWWHGLTRRGSGEEQVAGFCKCGNEKFGSLNKGNSLSSSGPVSFSRRTLFHGVN